MQKRYKKMIAGTLGLLLGLTCAVSPIHATELNNTDPESADAVKISSADDLIKFASRVNDDGEATLNAVLTDDIDMTGNTYIPIGKDRDHPYSGTFDGQEYTVTLGIESENFFVGIFGYIDGAKMLV